MPNLELLEVELSNRAQGEKDAEIFWHKYEAMKDHLDQQYYDWIQGVLPFYTDHGRVHVNSVIQATGMMIVGKLKEFSTLDLFLLLSSIIWHDVGMVNGRMGHEKRIVELTSYIKNLGFGDPGILRFVDEIVQAHTGVGSLKIPRDEAHHATQHMTYSVLPKELAALLRLADEISENHTRVSEEMLGRVPEDRQIYWQYANSIEAVIPEPARQRVVVTVAIQGDVAVRRFLCPDSFIAHADGEKRISLVEYLVCRLERMNNERCYCVSEFWRVPKFREIVVRLDLMRGTEAIPGYHVDLTLGDAALNRRGYPSIQIYDDFFNLHAQWKPTNVAEVLKR